MTFLPVPSVRQVSEPMTSSSPLVPRPRQAGDTSGFWRKNSARCVKRRSLLSLADREERSRGGSNPQLQAAADHERRAEGHGGGGDQGISGPDARGSAATSRAAVGNCPGSCPRSLALLPRRLGTRPEGSVRRRLPPRALRCRQPRVLTAPRIRQNTPIRQVSLGIVARVSPFGRFLPTERVKWRRLPSCHADHSYVADRSGNPP